MARCFITGGTRSGFFANLPIYNSMGTTLNSSPDFIMSVSSVETGWLGSHAQEIQNLFGLTNKGGNDLIFKGRGGYQASADYWTKHVGSYVRNAKTMPDFLTGLKKDGYNASPVTTRLSPISCSGFKSGSEPVRTEERP